MSNQSPATNHQQPITKEQEPNGKDYRDYVAPDELGYANLALCADPDR
ncbi:hypothetical protein KFU94_47765 [Chloroflexi bacterium TSY]|nr:hypothetical protein [Chloroflexi bacterium TSY]